MSRFFEQEEDMNKRDLLLSLIDQDARPESVPAAFFMHFDPAYHRGQAAVDKQLEYFRHTGMDFVKIQYEQGFPATSPILVPEDWKNARRVPADHFEPTLKVVEGLVKAAGAEALVIMTIYSPFMWLTHLAPSVDLAGHFQTNPAATAKGLEIMTENVLQLVRGCKRLGVDGFYISTQGGEAHRFPGTDIFRKYVKPSDLAVWEAAKECKFNILHVCDYEDEYADLTPFLDYPGQVVNCSLKLTERMFSPEEISSLFGRPFMGGLDRKGILATGSPQAIRQSVTALLAQAPERFILAADCTVPGTTSWDNLKIAIETAHGK
jgi:uroporphyrinogen decarboxylase